MRVLPIPAALLLLCLLPAHAAQKDLDDEVFVHDVPNHKPVDIDEEPVDPKITFKLGKPLGEGLVKVDRSLNNEIIIREEEPEWLGDLSNRTKVNLPVIEHLSCDACWLIRKELHTLIDAVIADAKGLEPTLEMVQQRIKYNHFCPVLQMQYRLTLDDEGALPKYKKSVSKKTVKGGWPSADFRNHCLYLMSTITHEELLQVALKRRAGEKPMHGSVVHFCTQQYRCIPDLTQERIEKIAREMRTKGYPNDNYGCAEVPRYDLRFHDGGVEEIPKVDIPLSPKERKVIDETVANQPTVDEDHSNVVKLVKDSEDEELRKAVLYHEERRRELEKRLGKWRPEQSDKK